MRHALFLLFGIGASGLLIWAFRTAGPPPRAPAQPSPRLAKGALTPDSLSMPTALPAADAAAKVNRPAEAPALAGQAGILAAIETASTSYDPAALPRIQPFLTHPDPEIRAAALAGMVNLGHAAGAPVLRAAARQLTDSKEAISLLEAADYLELPPAPKSMRGRVRAVGSPAAPRSVTPAGTTSSQSR